jgi:hypothetical protein
MLKSYLCRLELQDNSATKGDLGGTFAGWKLLITISYPSLGTMVMVYREGG